MVVHTWKFNYKVDLGRIIALGQPTKKVPNLISKVTKEKVLVAWPRGRVVA
jgi:hypothetical protein